MRTRVITPAATLLLGLLLWLGASASQPTPESVIDVQHYRFELALSDSSDEIRGTAEVKIRFREPAERFVLNLVEEADGEGMTVLSVREDGTPIEFTHEGQEITIVPSAAPASGEKRTYQIRYRGVPADGLIISENRYGDRTFFGDNWPNRARHWLPTNDHPSDKATVEFAVAAPAHYNVVSNGRLVEETSLERDRELTRWRTGIPLPTKVMVIGVARFAVDHLEDYEGIPVQSWVYPENRREGFYDFALAREILAYFEERIGAFPFEKLANVQSTTRYGGMENASTIFYAEDAVTGTREAESLLAHEIAHQWFGDAVTETDWKHLWLSEGFATYLTHLYMESTYGPERLDERLERDRRRILQFADRAPNRPVIDSLASDPNTLLNANSYQKGGWVLHMLRERIGRDVLWEGLAAFYEEYRDGNADTDDFERVMEEVSGDELDTFFDQWLRRPGVPALEGQWSYEDGHVVVHLRQLQAAPYDLFVDIGIVAPGSDTPRVETVDLDERSATFRLPAAGAPERVVLDPGVDLLAEMRIRRR